MLVRDVVQMSLLICTTWFVFFTLQNRQCEKLCRPMLRGKVDFIDLFKSIKSRLTRKLKGPVLYAPGFFFDF